MATYHAIKSWQVHYSDPIRGTAGDRLTLGRRDDEFPGWVWATAADGRSTTFEVAVMLLTPKEVEYFRNGGLLHYVLRQLAGHQAA